MIDEYSFAIIGREYVADADVKIQRIEAVKDFGTYLQDKNLNEADSVPDENILILWNKFTEKEIKKNQKKFHHNTDVLLERFLKRIADKIRTEQEKGNMGVKTFIKIYIDDPYTFYDDCSHDLFFILKRIYMIYKITGIIPIIMEGNFLLETRKEDLADDVEKTIEEIVTEPKPTKGYAARFNSIIEAVEREHFHNKAADLIDRDYFKRFFSSIELLMDYAQEALMEKKEPELTKTKDGDDEPKFAFIDLYIQYQNGKSGMDCSYDMGKDSPNTWYTRAREFEKNIWYAEYMNAYYDEVVGRGLVMGKIKEKMFDYLSMYKTRVRTAAYNMGNPRKGVYDIYEELDYIRSVIDVDRCAITCYKHYCDLKNSMSKEELKKLLKKYGVNESDIDIKFVSTVKAN